MYWCRLFITVVALGLSGCVFVAPPRAHDPKNVAKACADKALRFEEPNRKGLNILLAIDGHLYTSYAIAAMAGYKGKRLLTLAYFSQYPDIDPDYDARFASFRFFLLLPGYAGWHNTVNGMLHSLHGGDQIEIDRRRAAIQRALASTLKDPNQDWMSGLLIHAYGDAYVHTKGTYKTGQEEAYGRVFGHAWDYLMGNDPDGIKNPVTEPKYLAYVDELYHLLDSKYPPDRPDDDLEDFKEQIKKMQCEVGKCPIVHAVSNLNPETSQNQLDVFAACMTQATRLLPHEIEKAMSLIKND